MTPVSVPVKPSVAIEEQRHAPEVEVLGADVSGATPAIWIRSTPAARARWVDGNPAGETPVGEHPVRLAAPPRDGARLQLSFDASPPVTLSVQGLSPVTHQLDLGLIAPADPATARWYEK